MARRDSNWVRLFDSIYVADTNGARIRLVRGQAAPAAPVSFDTLKAWLPGAMRGTDVQRKSVALTVAGLNVVSESIDGNATIADPVLHDWPQVRALLGRASIALGTGDANAAAYLGLIDKLNSNNATITPVKPAACPKSAVGR